MDTRTKTGETPAPGAIAGGAASSRGAAARARSKDELMNDFRTLIGDGEALLRSMSNLSGEALAQAREEFRSQLADAQVRLSDASRVALERGRRTAAATDDYVRAHPWPVIGAAAAAGLVLGALIARR